MKRYMADYDGIDEAAPPEPDKKAHRRRRRRAGEAQGLADAGLEDALPLAMSLKKPSR